VPRFDFLVMYRKVGEFGPSRIATCTTGWTPNDYTQPPTVWINNFRTTDPKALMDPATGTV